MASTNTKFQEIVSKAIARVTDDRGEWIEPNEQMTDETRFAWALLSVAGQGPFEEQAARQRAWAEEREQRFGAVRDVLDKLGISSQVGPLERQVEILGEQRDQLRQLLTRNTDPAPPLESMMITPIVDREVGQIVFLSISFRGSPGFELKLTGAAGAELRDFLIALPGLCGAQLPPPPASAEAITAAGSGPRSSAVVSMSCAPPPTCDQALAGDQRSAGRQPLERQEPPWAELDDGICETVRALWRAGFAPTDSGYGGKVGMECALGVPNVFMRCAPRELVAEADRLHALVASWGLPDPEPGSPRIQGSYAPDDGLAVLALFGVHDGMLPVAARSGS